VTGWGSESSFVDSIGATLGGPQVEVELVGPHLRVGGRISLGRFGRLTDRVNHSRGFILLEDARLLKRNGDPTSLVVQELWVNQDEVTFIGVAHFGLDERPAGELTGDRPMIAKVPRQYVVFTPGHSISGNIHVHEGMSLSNFVDATDPRFIPMTAVAARSLADRRVVSRFELLLMNRTQMTAIAEADRSSSGPEGLTVETG
jgi:hypothetical protein